MLEMTSRPEVKGQKETGIG